MPRVAWPASTRPASGASRVFDEVAVDGPAGDAESLCDLSDRVVLLVVHCPGLRGLCRCDSASAHAAAGPVGGKAVLGSFDDGWPFTVQDLMGAAHRCHTFGKRRIFMRERQDVGTDLDSKAMARAAQEALATTRTALSTTDVEAVGLILQKTLANQQAALGTLDIQAMGQTIQKALANQQAALGTLDIQAMGQTIQKALANQQAALGTLDTKAMSRAVREAMTNQQAVLGRLDFQAMGQTIQKTLEAQHAALGTLDTKAMTRAVREAVASQQTILGHRDTRAMIRSAQAVLVAQRATLGNLDTAVFREAVLKPALKDIKLDELVQTLQENTDDVLLADGVNDVFSEIPESGALLDEAAQELTLMIPFGHDLAVRRALQIVVMLIVAAAIIGISLYAGPLVAAIMAAVSTPKPQETWKAVGKAYDRIYGVGQYHPEKALKARTPAGGPSQNHPSDW